MAKLIVEQDGNKWVDVAADERRQAFVEFGLPRNIERMKRDLARYRVNFDNWLLESSLHKSGYVADTIQLLTDAGLTYEKDGMILKFNLKDGSVSSILYFMQ